MDSAVRGGARRVGFVFYPPSPRNVAIDRAASLAARVPPGVDVVGVFVEPEDSLLDEVLDRAPLSMLQLHGRETPRRVAELRARYGLPTIKAVDRRGARTILARAETYAGVADSPDVRREGAARRGLAGGATASPSTGGCWRGASGAGRGCCRAG